MAWSLQIATQEHNAKSAGPRRPGSASVGNGPGDVTGRAAEPLLDPAGVESLVADVGRERLGLAFKAFREELVRRSPRVVAVLAAGDIATLAREMHAIKGSALTFGALRLGVAARAVDDACRAGDVERALDGAPAVLSLLQMTVEAVAELEASTAEEAKR
jgi:HPt (histidine-containing phosphotransfer) domain-containing protein